jgi:hypothetical protein
LANCVRDFKAQLRNRVARAKLIFDMADFSARSLTRAEHEEVKGILAEMRAIKRRLDDALRNQELRE